ncbi:MAG: phosphate signaling complex protein PhoU [Spirochaetaceae bacterium]|jgi:phosphate transport system protein|nr:phosphate signaling complex protein PhoU [Spirochaetaceae bacterium]
MRETYQKQLGNLHTELIRMGALCEDAIADAIKALVTGDAGLREKVWELEREIDLKEREIESFSVHLLLREQPVAGDLRRITAAQRMITDMERIGDQAADIAELSRFIADTEIIKGIPMAEMAAAAAKMLTDSVDAFVAADLEKAYSVIAYDKVVDEYFVKVKDRLISLVTKNSEYSEACIDLLMIAKYLERIGDHAQNIAEWVEYYITGKRGK